jgi:hypothetical protein
MVQTSKVAGIVQIDGTPAERTVRAFGYNATPHDIDGEPVTLSKSLGNATSDPADGSYTIDLLAGYSSEVFLVAFDDYGDAFTAEQAMAVGDRIHPTTPNGHVFETTGAGDLPAEEPTWIVDTETSQLYGTASMIARTFYRPMVHGPIAPELSDVAIASISGGDLVYEVDINGTMHRVHEFTANGVAEVVGAPVVELLVVGGGGSGGGNNTGGGGGAGGFLRFSGIELPEGANSILIGLGGAGGVTGGEGNNGEDSLAFGYTAIGGGGGGHGGRGVTTPGLDGGSGGGGGGSFQGADSPGGTGSQGNDGGTGLDTPGQSNRAAGGGGGAGTPGDNQPSSRGGEGLAVSITGTNRHFAGGGGGGHGGSGNTAGGIGGGGRGADSGNLTPGSGANNTGGGSGGMRYDGSPAGSGGSGIVIVAYPI